MTREKILNELQFEELVDIRDTDTDSWTMEEWNEYERIVKQRAPKYLQKLEFMGLGQYYEKYSSGDIDPWFDAWAHALEHCYPFSEIFENIHKIEKTLRVLLNTLKDKPANITIGQLNRMKGGI